MVSLINFKIVSEELSSPSQPEAMPAKPQQQQQQTQQQQQFKHANEHHQLASHMFVTRSSQMQQQQQDQHRHNQSQSSALTNHSPLDIQTGGQMSMAPIEFQQTANNQTSQLQLFRQPDSNQADSLDTTQSSLSCFEAPNFVVTWRNLQFAIKPKWHQKMLSARTSGQQQASAPPSTKIVLDKLDGSFRSGELTAILGPSGAGKTTLLDCLTGRRKHGLSGSIRLSSAAPVVGQGGANNSNSSSNNNNNNNNNNKSHFKHISLQVDARHDCLNGAAEMGAKSITRPNKKNLSCCPNARKLGTPKAVAAAAAATTMPTSGDNLKVSIIPQNDHLMGHLTVYETLNYASKMKNCHQKQFNHQLNIKRVAQQLGLMDCLGTRVNKLSGGQYKRVSIAQELLSSPDILILDEPTSGLDAMTCYQTVQVLRKLTDERQSSGRNQIAVILTIHQPNSDVFQQFNHVYVVAQGGKCIYEGPPARIESVINRVGLRLPSSYYNPATMIVEIAAGKFGAEAIQKLNSIQKKQYEFLAQPADEQTSTGDSAVDCPSSSPSSSNDEDDDDEDGGGNNIERPAGIVVPGAPERSLVASFVNKAFVMDSADNADTNNNNKDVIVVVAKGGGGGAGDHQLDADSVDKIKMISSAAAAPAATDDAIALDCEGRRKKRRRTRRRSGDQGGGGGGDQANGANNKQAGEGGRAPMMLCADFVSGCGGGGNSQAAPREKRLKLNSLKADQKFPFWRHTYLHFHRSWLSIVRDPMLCSMQLALHIIVPLMVSLVYGPNVGKPNACPRAGPMDIMAYALEPTDSALQLQEDLRTTLENIGYIFFKLYGLIFAAMTVTVLTFPLDMHVLVKEFRNGWYGMSSYFLGRTLADIPFQLTLPLLAMSLSYYATGQPYSYLQWRFLSITAILILSSLIAQSQGLLFGAILMDKMKAAVFVAPAATTPIILFAGFLVRTQSIPRYLRPLANFSYLRYAIEACLISRYGFNQCECDPAVFNQTVPELPPIARSMLDYWLSSFRASAASGSDLGNDSSPTSSALGLAANSTAATLGEAANSLIETTTLAAATSGEKPDLFTKLIDSLAKANSFGRNITSCEQVVPYPMIDYDLKDSQLLHCFAILLFMLLFTRLLTFFIVCFKVKRRV